LWFFYGTSMAVAYSDVAVDEDTNLELLERLAASTSVRTAVF